MPPHVLLRTGMVRKPESADVVQDLTSVLSSVCFEFVPLLSFTAHRTSPMACIVETWRWHPPVPIMEILVGLTLAERDDLGRVFVRVGRRQDWGVDAHPRGGYRFHYYSDVATLGLPGEVLPPWVKAIARGEGDRKAAFALVFARAAGVVSP